MKINVLRYKHSKHDTLYQNSHAVRYSIHPYTFTVRGRSGPSGLCGSSETRLTTGGSRGVSTLYTYSEIFIPLQSEAEVDPVDSVEPVRHV